MISGMTKFYVLKIENCVINMNTGKEWCLEDVPKLWKTKVENELTNK